MQAVTAVIDYNIYRWSVGGRGEGVSAWHDNTVQALAFSPASGLLAAGCAGGALSLWPPDTSAHAPVMTQVDGHDLGVTGCQFSREGALVTAGNDGDVKIWSVHWAERELRCEAVIRAHHTSILSLWLSEEILVTGAGDKTSKVKENYKGESKLFENTPQLMKLQLSSSSLLYKSS